MTSNDPYLQQHFNMQQFNIPREPPPTSWQPVSVPNAQLPQNQLQDNIFHFEIPSYFAPVQQASPASAYHQYSTVFTAQQPLSSPNQKQLRSEPRPVELSQFFSDLNGPTPHQGKMVQAQAPIRVQPFQTGVPDQNAAMINYLLQQGYTLVQPVVSQPPQSMIAQPQLPLCSVNKQPQPHPQPIRPPQPTAQPQLPASFLQQHLQKYPLQQLEAVVPKPLPPTKPQLLPSSALYAQLQQQHHQQIVAQLPLLSAQSLHSMSPADLKKQELLLEEMIRRSKAVQHPISPIKQVTKPSTQSNPFPFSVHQSPLKMRAQQPLITTMSKKPPVQELPALQKLAALQTNLKVSPEKLRPVAPVAPSLRLQEPLLSLITDSRLLGSSIPDQFQHPNPAIHHKSSPNPLPSSFNTPPASCTSQPSPTQAQKAPSSNPVSRSDLPPWHSLSLDAQRNVFLNQNAIVEAARREEMNAVRRVDYHRKKAERDERRRREQEVNRVEEPATWKSWRTDGVPPPTPEQEKQRARKAVTLDEKREKQRARNRAYRNKNYVRVIGDVRPVAGSSKDEAVTRFPGQLNIKAEPIDDKSELIEKQIRLEVRLSHLLDQPTPVAEQAETLHSEIARQPSPKTPEQKPILDGTPLLASLLSLQSRVSPTTQAASPLSLLHSLSYEVSREATRSSTLDSQMSDQIQPPSLLLQVSHREHSETAQPTEETESRKTRPLLVNEVSPKKKNRPIKCDRLNKAARSYYERKKTELGQGPAKEKVALTDEEKRAKRAAASRVWRVKNYVKIIGEFPQAEPMGRKKNGHSSNIPMLRNIKMEPLDEIEEQNPSAYQSLIDWEDQAIDHATRRSDHSTEKEPWDSPASSDYSVEL